MADRSDKRATDSTGFQRYNLWIKLGGILLLGIGGWFTLQNNVSNNANAIDRKSATDSRQFQRLREHRELINNGIVQRAVIENKIENIDKNVESILRAVKK